MATHFVRCKNPLHYAGTVLGYGDSMTLICWLVLLQDPYRAPTPYSSHGGGYPFQDSGRLPDYRDTGRVPDYQDGNRSYQSSGRSYQDDRHLYGYPTGPGYGGYPQYSDPSYAPSYVPSVAAAPSDDEDSNDHLHIFVASLKQQHHITASQLFTVVVFRPRLRRRGH